MIQVVLRSHAATLAEWANMYRLSDAAGAKQMAALLSRAAALGEEMAAGGPITVEPLEVGDPPVEHPKEG